MKSSDHKTVASQFVTVVGLTFALALGFFVVNQGNFVAKGEGEKVLGSATSGASVVPKATTYSRNLVKYGWDGKCFQKTSLFKFGARYQCKGKIGNYPQGCQGRVSKRTGVWQYNSRLNPLSVQGQSNVCIVPSGKDGPKDSNGCFTQQLIVDDGSAGSPEGFYSFDSCGGPTPTDPKPTAKPTSKPAPTKQPL